MTELRATVDRRTSYIEGNCIPLLSHSFSVRRVHWKSERHQLLHLHVLG